VELDAVEAGPAGVGCGLAEGVDDDGRVGECLGRSDVARLAREVVEVAASGGDCGRRADGVTEGLLLRLVGVRDAGEVLPGNDSQEGEDVGISRPEVRYADPEANDRHTQSWQRI
jgi:hypothetical protein